MKSSLSQSLWRMYMEQVRTIREKTGSSHLFLNDFPDFGV